MKTPKALCQSSFFASVKKNRTQKSWITDNLGAPHRYDMGPNNEEFLTYHFSHARYRQASLLFVMRFQGSENEQRHYHVMVCDGVVKKAWWDNFSEVQVAKMSHKSGCETAPSTDTLATAPPASSQLSMNTSGNAEMAPSESPSSTAVPNAMSVGAEPSLTPTVYTETLSEAPMSPSNEASQ